jgi:ribosomal protein S18 acetylase RimI-like enzyme
VLVRYAKESELEIVGELTLAASGGLAAGEDAEALGDAASRAEEAQLLVCVDGDGRIVGTATYVEVPSRWAQIAGPDEAEIRMLAVHHMARGYGAGKALVEHTAKIAVGLGKQRLVCSCNPAMETAQRLLARSGFTRAPERDWSPAGGAELLVYVRELV